jgi:ring-1,2-phenylacetyl-CoA epoxidase subunit PaaC
VLSAQGIAVDLQEIKQLFYGKLQQVLSMATLVIPDNTAWSGGGKQGKHTAAMAVILAEMQYLQRTYPGAIW